MSRDELSLAVLQQRCWIERAKTFLETMDAALPSSPTLQRALGPTVLELLDTIPNVEIAHDH